MALTKADLKLAEAIGFKNGYRDAQKGLFPIVRRAKRGHGQFQWDYDAPDYYYIKELFAWAKGYIKGYQQAYDDAERTPLKPFGAPR